MTCQYFNHFRLPIRTSPGRFINKVQDAKVPFLVFIITFWIIAIISDRGTEIKAKVRHKVVSLKQAFNQLYVDIPSRVFNVFLYETYPLIDGSMGPGEMRRKKAAENVQYRIIVITLALA
ncbi:hypothetical protein CIL06_19940 [Pantoea vagans]|nr:hypothetical protein CIL06_19940 [Pantoea vagans]